MDALHLVSRIRADLEAIRNMPLPEDRNLYYIDGHLKAAAAEMQKTCQIVDDACRKVKL